MTRTSQHPAEPRVVEMTRLDIPLDDPFALADVLLRYTPVATLIVLVERLADELAANVDCNADGAA